MYDEYVYTESIKYMLEFIFVFSIRPSQVNSPKCYKMLLSVMDLIPATTTMWLSSPITGTTRCISGRKRTVGWIYDWLIARDVRMRFFPREDGIFHVLSSFFDFDVGRKIVAVKFVQFSLFGVVVEVIICMVEFFVSI